MSTDDQQSLDSFIGAQEPREPSDEDEEVHQSPYRAAWESDEQADDYTSLDHRPTRCQHCERPVTLKFRRVFGDNDDIAWCCQQCTDTINEYQQGARDPDWYPGKYETESTIKLSGIAKPAGGFDA